MKTLARCAFLLGVMVASANAADSWDAYKLADATPREGAAWPLQSAVEQELGNAASPRQCDTRECFLAALSHHELAVFSGTFMGDDSLIGRAAVARADGRIVLLSYDSSPCGQVAPSGSCGYSLRQHFCESIADSKADARLLCDSPRFELEAKK